MKTTSRSLLLIVGISICLWTPSITRADLIDDAGKGDLPAVNADIGAGADVNVTVNEGNTALTWAADNGHVVCVNALIAAGADVNAKLDRGKTALMFAARYDHADCVALLQAAGALL
jgi:ankyrin repeat protein